MEPIVPEPSSSETIDLIPRLAGYLLGLREGEQLLSTRDLSEQFNASLGSISAATNGLEESGAVTINRRGRLGSFLEKRSPGLLWKVIENGPLVIALTLPSFPRCEGLATAIYTLLDQAGFETYLIFIRGSYNRIKALRNGRCHAIVLSQLSAEEICGPGEEIVLALPPQSFVTDHRVFFRRRKENSGPLKVGIDYDSYDMQYLTELEFAGQEVEFHPMTFIQSDLHLAKSPVDAAISNLDHLERLKSDEISSRPLSPRVQALIGDRDTSAALVIRTGAVAVRTAIGEVLIPERMLEIQQKVVEGLLVPRY
jgi:hypothetical protein